LLDSLLQEMEGNGNHELENVLAKRKINDGIEEEEGGDEKDAKRQNGVGSTVASHYNNLKEGGLESRKESRIFFMRNFNNWIKSMLMQEYVSKLEAKGLRGLKVLDLGCGKGGDLLKWQKSRVSHVTGLDIAETSIEQCHERFKKMNERRNQNSFSGEFYAADCTKVRTRDLYSNPDMEFDIVSCQFAFHYCFESLPQAECMLKNISENLKIGGFFIGTTPCAYEIMSRLQKAGGSSFGNSVYNISFPEDMVAKPPLFGAQYNFHLEGVVDCPEFLVYLPLLEKLATKFGLLLVGKERFGNYFNKKKNHESSLNLLRRMSALEPYPSRSLLADREQYAFAEKCLSEDVKMVGTLSRDEWEALNIYTVFAFKKMNEPQ